MDENMYLRLIASLVTKLLILVLFLASNSTVSAPIMEVEPSCFTDATYLHFAVLLKGKFKKGAYKNRSFNRFYSGLCSLKKTECRFLIDVNPDKKLGIWNPLSSEGWKIVSKLGKKYNVSDGSLRELTIDLDKKNAYYRSVDHEGNIEVEAVGKCEK